MQRVERDVEFRVSYSHLTLLPKEGRINFSFYLKHKGQFDVLKPSYEEGVLCNKPPPQNLVA